MWKKIHSGELASDIRQVLHFMKICGVRMRFFLRSLGLSLAMTIFSLYTVSLLFPLVQDIVGGSFSNVAKLPAIGLVVGHFPGIFSTTTRLFILLVVWIYVTIVIKNILQYSAFLTTSHQAKTATVRLRDLLIDKCLAFGKSFYDKNSVASIHATITKNTATIENQFSLLQTLIIQAFLLVAYLGIMIYISWKLTLIAVIVFPIVNLVTRKIIRRIQEAMRSADAAYKNVSKKIFNLIYCMPVVRGFAKEKEERAIFKEASDWEIEESFRAQKYSNLIDPVEEIGATTATLLLACGMALLLYLDHSLTAANAFVFFYIATKMLPALNAINDFRTGMINSETAVEAISEILDGSDSFIIKGGPKKFDSLKKAISVRGLTFAYDVANVLVPGANSNPAGNFAPSPALNNVSFTIEKGKTTAIVGPTGSGKSTIASLLLRFYDCPPGSIFFDETDIRDFDLASLRQKISFVSQDVLLFGTTVEHNMAYGIEEPTENEVPEIGMKTAVHDFVSRLPEGYKSVVNERGSNFSGGERQRISIARALAKKADIIILDEAASSLDAKTEERIRLATEEITRGKTVIVISHRFKSIQNADKIMYLENGAIRESGTPAELMAKQGAFYQQWQAQTI